MTFQQKGPWSKKTYVSWISNGIICDIWKKLTMPAHFLSCLHLKRASMTTTQNTMVSCLSSDSILTNLSDFMANIDNLAWTIWWSSRIWLKPNMSFLAFGWFHAEYLQLSPWIKNRASISRLFFLAGVPFWFTRIGAQVGLDIQGSHVDPGGQPGLKKREKTLIEQFITKLEKGQRKSERQKSTPF